MTLYTQQVRGSEAVEDARIGPAGLITVDTDTYSLRIHDGLKPGGYKIPNEDHIAGFSTRGFMARNAQSVPGNLTAAAVSDLNEFTTAGTWVLPSLGDVPNIGDILILCATVSDVTVDAFGTNQILDQGAVVTSLSLVANELVTIAKRSATQYIVMNRY